MQRNSKEARGLGQIVRLELIEKKLLSVRILECPKYVEDLFLFLTSKRGPEGSDLASVDRIHCISGMEEFMFLGLDVPYRVDNEIEGRCGASQESREQGSKGRENSGGDR